MLKVSRWSWQTRRPYKVGHDGVCYDLRFPELYSELRSRCRTDQCTVGLYRCDRRRLGHPDRAQPLELNVTSKSHYRSETVETLIL